MTDQSIADSSAPTQDPLMRSDYTRWLASLQRSHVPSQLHEGLARYLVAGIQPGSFLMAVLSGDNATAIRRADDTCLAGYGSILLWLLQHAPAESWGSAENVQTWRDQCRAENWTGRLSAELGTQKVSA